MSQIRRQLMEIFERLLAHYGPQGWWPADGPTETILGCILVQHSSWKSVERAIANLKSHQLIDFSVLDKIEAKELAPIIRPAGTPRIKAQRLLNFTEWLKESYHFDLKKLAATPVAQLREMLLAIHGIGPETADTIILYGIHQSTFVIDTYTSRVVVRHLLADRKSTYTQLKNLFENHLDFKTQMFNEYHALLVAVGKEHCRKAAQCAGCPLEHLPHDPNRI